MDAAFPTIQTNRLLLRQIQPEDVLKVFEALSHPEIIKYYGVYYTTLENTQEQMAWYKSIWEEKTGIWWGISIVDNPGELVGACGFNHWSQRHRHAEMGYWLLPNHQRKGIMSEALESALDYGFKQMNLHRITAVVEPRNTASIWLLEKLNFNQEGHFKDAEIKHGKFVDLHQYALLSTDK